LQASCKPSPPQGEPNCEPSPSPSPSIERRDGVNQVCSPRRLSLNSACSSTSGTALSTEEGVQQTLQNFEEQMVRRQEKQMEKQMEALKQLQTEQLQAMFEQMLAKKKHQRRQCECPCRKRSGVIGRQHHRAVLAILGGHCPACASAHARAPQELPSFLPSPDTADNTTAQCIKGSSLTWQQRATRALHGGVGIQQ